MKRLVLILWLFSCFISGFAQTSKVSELLAQLNAGNSDSLQMSIMRKLSAAYTVVDPVKKFYYANQYRLLAEKNKIDSTISNAYQDMGISYAVRGNLDSAMYYFNLGKDKAKESNFEKGLARSYVNIGYTYDRLDRKKEAVQLYEEALKIYRKINFKKGISQCITNLGSLYFDLNQFKIAQGYFQQVFADLQESPNDEIGLGNVLFSLGACSRKLGDAKKSMEFYQRSLAIREKIGDLNGIALSNWGISELYVEAHEYAKALPYLDIALKNNRLLKNVYHEGAVLITLAKAQLGLEDYKAAEETANLALLKARETNAKIPVSLALNLLAKISAAQKKFDAALNFKSAYNAVNDSLNVPQTINDVVVEDLHRVNADNLNLKNDNRNITEKVSDYILFITISIVLLIIVVIFLVLYYKRNLEKKEVNFLLKKQSQLIADANEELSALNEELSTQMDIVSNQNLELEKLNDVKNKFFSIVSHDLRGPVNTLKMLFELYRGGDVSEKEMNEMLVTLEGTIDNTATFLDNLLEWSRSQLEGVVVKPSVFQISALVSENIELMDSQIKLKSLKVENKIPAGISVFADSNMVNTVVRNLLSNAIKFCSTNDMIVFDAELNDKDVVFTIKDTGPGINDADKQNLFNLAQTISRGTSGETGYHIGLLLCKDMVRQNSGEITVESEIGNGTTFSVTLPRN